MRNPPTLNSARITEIFSSLQGEGTRAGEKHIFVRFEECNIACQYCDEIHKRGKPLSVDEVMAEIRRLEAENGPHAFISLTGGEPLLYVVFLKSLIPLLKKEGFRIYLETAGILWKALEEIVGWCDCIAMDMKTPSVTAEQNFDKEHRQFLEIAKNRETFIKIVVSNKIIPSEFLEQVAIIRKVAPQTPLILMPLSAEIGGHEDPELVNLMQDLKESAVKQISDVRIVPRLHKILGIR